MRLEPFALFGLTKQWASEWLQKLDMHNMQYKLIVQTTQMTIKYKAQKGWLGDGWKCIGHFE